MTYKLSRDQAIPFLDAISVTASKVGRDPIICSYFSLCRNLIFSVTIVVVYSAYVSDRDLKSMSRP